MGQEEIKKEGEWQTKDTIWGPVTFRIDKNMPDYNYPYFIKKVEKMKKTLSQIPGFIPEPSTSEK